MLMRKMAHMRSHTTVIERKTYPTKCRYCGQKVFYHQNEYGSKVFFNELGNHWDRHMCAEYLKQRTRH